MGKHYNIDQPNDFRKIHVVTVLVSVLILILVMGISYIIYDLNHNKLVINNDANKAILGVFGSNQTPFKEVEMDQYTISVPASWRRVNNPEVIINGRAFYPERFQGIEGDDIGRRIDIYSGSIPAELGINKVVKVSSVGNRMRFEQQSAQCYTFVDNNNDKQLGNYSTEWHGVEFTCNTSRITNVLGTVEKQQSTGVILDTSQGGTGYFLVYMDHGSSQNNGIFRKIIDSFEAK